MNDKLKFDIDESKVKGFGLLDNTVRGKIREAEDFINKLDLNKNGIPDIQELGVALEQASPFVKEALPVLASLSQSIDFELMAEDIINKPWVKNKAALVEEIKNLGALAEKAGKIAEMLNSLPAQK